MTELSGNFCHFDRVPEISVTRKFRGSVKRSPIFEARKFTSQGNTNCHSVPKSEIGKIRVLVVIWVFSSCRHATRHRDITTKRE